MQSPTESEQSKNLAPGLTIEVRDEEWLVTAVSNCTDGQRVKARGLSDYVRDTQATFFTSLDKITIFDPTKVTVTPDTSPHYQFSRLWVETNLRQTPIPLHQDSLTVSTQMLADPLDYQMQAVRKALSSDNIRPRILLADAVGLGKTLEIGMIVAELVRRGRGDRILIVTPKHVLEQFQQEMWTRFALPFVRLDTEGIQRVRQKLPASKNPFTYFPRAIISIDTLKMPKYRAQLEKVNWDVVVIDEVHNALNAGTMNNQLARTLAKTTESLIVASATPHNGDPESFKEILRLLDPLAVKPNGDIDMKVAQNLIIRRHRNSPEVASVVGDQWAQRLEPKNIVVPANPQEIAVAEEIYSTWTKPGCTPPCDDRLFPWTLVKASLSSPAALLETVENRLAKSPVGKELQALKVLRQRALEVTDDNSSKLDALVKYLKQIGVSKNSSTRAVVFSERVTTLNWLKKVLPARLGVKENCVEVMHGALTDMEQARLVDEFKRESSPVRVLITGDVASEGVNLHAQCHHLVHFDIPWSLIRIQQRNGRIDRYGQKYPPQIVTLLLDTKQDEASELKVLRRLIEREHAAYEVLGEVSPLMGSHSVKAEEDAIRQVLQGKHSFDEVVRTPEQIMDAAADNDDAADADEIVFSDPADFIASILAASASTEEAEKPAGTETVLRSLYSSEKNYLLSALNVAFHGYPHRHPDAGGVSLEVSEEYQRINFVPPADLQRKFGFLPQDYVSARHVREKVSLVTDPVHGKGLLQAAREGDSSISWPVSHFLSPLHPVSAWAADKALASMPRREIPAVSGAVDSPTLLVMGTLTNHLGQVVTRALYEVSRSQWGTVDTKPLEDPVEWLEKIGVGEQSINDGSTAVPQDVDAVIAEFVKAASDSLFVLLNAAKDLSKSRLDVWKKRADQWRTQCVSVARSRVLVDAEKMIASDERLAGSLIPDRPLVRPLLLVVPALAS